MGTNQTPSATRTTRWGWRIVVVMTTMLTLNGIILFFFISDSPLMRTVSVQETGVGLLALLVAWEGYRHNTRWAWRALWALFALLLALAIQILTGGEIGVGAWYLALAAGLLVGLLLARGGLTANSVRWEAAHE